MIEQELTYQDLRIPSSEIYEAMGLLPVFRGMISARHGINLLIACWKILSIRWPTNRALRFI